MEAPEGATNRCFPQREREAPSCLMCSNVPYKIVLPANHPATIGAVDADRRGKAYYIVGRCKASDSISSVR